MTPHEALKAARALIADEQNWIKGSFKRVIDGRVCYCADGALEEVDPALGDAYGGANRALRAASPDQTVYGYNDEPETTHADVLAWFDRAIEATAPEVPA